MGWSVNGDTKNRGAAKNKSVLFKGCIGAKRNLTWGKCFSDNGGSSTPFLAAPC